MKVLVVDDDSVGLLTLKALLADAGYQVLSASDGRQALEILRKEPCRLVISDWEMPVMNGIELCQAIRGEYTSGYVYFILLTSYAAVEHRVQGLSAGADDFITKPFEPAEMLARVRSGERLLSLETRDVAIFALAKLAESRDPATGAHLERIQSYCRCLAQHLAGTPNYCHQITAEFIRLIHQTSPLHDIGKVGIPDAILLKPGRLTDDEFDIMKFHTSIGASTLDAALQKFPDVPFLEMARDIVASHHERFDGTGYPEGLSGTRIPLSARIMALADVYDALTSKRVYKAALAHTVARSMILQERGSHFDPDVVEAFIQTESRFIAIRDQFAEVEIQPGPAPTPWSHNSRRQLVAVV